MSLTREQLVSMYRALVGSRLAEQAITDLTTEGIIRGHHSGLGHEAIGVAVGMAVRPDDGVQGSHRSGMMLAHARGGYSLRDALLSQVGLVPSHYAIIAGRPRTVMAVGLVGSQIPLAVGTAMADRLKGKDTVVVSFFGDGAANEGAVHEGMNFAGARRLPIVFIVENNGFAISMPMNEATAAEDFAARAAGYGMPGVVVDGHDPVAVYEVVEAAVRRAREGEGPSLIEARLLRWEPHAHGLADTRSEQERALARERDGVRNLRTTLVTSGVLSEAEAAAIEAECRSEVEAAVAEARAAPKGTRSTAVLTPEDARNTIYAN
ncbi:MAG: thiamine pyrophosphate-dependent dehydrogenase E1 component subunit alpha [Dehalococcoidia bacterium]